MNADIAKAGIYDKLVLKQVTAMADIRNKAAHGRWTEFERGDVDLMVPWVRRFITERS